MDPIDLSCNFPKMRLIFREGNHMKKLTTLGLICGFLFIGCSDDDKTVTPDVGVDLIADITTSDIQADLSEEDKVKITDIIPNNGPSCPFQEGGAEGNCDGSVLVVLAGQNFKAGATYVYVQGGDYIYTADVTSPASLSFRMEKQPYDTTKPFRAGITVLVEQEQSNTVFYNFWVTEEADADNKGVILAESASVDAYTDYPSETIQGKVYVKDITDQTQGADGRINVEFGIGPKGGDPKKDKFRWYPASFKADDGDYDIYEGTVKPALTGEYALAMRFSKQLNVWIVADTDESDLSYQPSAEALLNATQAPIDFCFTSDDCVVHTFTRVCEVDANDWKQNHCIECKADQDCVDNTKSLGPVCDVANQKCICTGDTDCTGHINGGLCMAEQYCGCQQPTDCEEPNVCYQDFPAEGMYTCGPPQN